MGACSSAARPEAQPSPVKLREEATRAKAPTPPPCAPCAPSVVSGSGGSSDGRAGGSAEQVAEALDQEEARQLSLFRAEVRRTSWLSGSVSAALPDLSGLWHAEWSRASRRRSKRAQASDDSAAGGSVAGRLLLVNVVGRGETWSALALGDDARELCWQADSTGGR